ncbi:hypothetical protein [Bacillus sp. 165]|uniref:hypothetical protein n=1 Tax=Bacillus sp. 165 TaxID=1529117 RepID=UPI001AD995A2|nr:hypothetical protein [Bacillus sp. 165]MBO9130406.1 hypothetical protein [Bacillus sp. 165]
MLKYVFMFVIFSYLFSTLFQWDMQFWISALCVVIIFYALFTVRAFVRMVGSVFLLTGVLLLWRSGADWKEYILSFGPMLDLLTLFALIPILGSPVRLGGYAKGIQTIIQKKVKTSGHLYIMTSGISYFLSMFMNLATLPMTYYSIRPSLSLFSITKEERFMSRAITHGFAMPLVWAPITPIVGIVISVTGVSWVSILPFVLPLSVLGLALDWILAARSARKSVTRGMRIDGIEDETAASVQGVPPYGRVVHIFMAILLFNLIISFAEHLFSYPFVIIVSLLVIPFAFGWSFLIKQTKPFLHSLQEYFHSYSDKMKDQFFIFLSAGFFISAVKAANINEAVNMAVTQFKDMVGVEAFLIVLPLIPLAFAFTGLHPAVTLALMAEALDPKGLGISPHILTVSLLAGAVSAFLVGPYNATIGLMSSIVKENSFKVSNWNIPFTISYLGIVMLYLFGLEWFL